MLKLAVALSTVLSALILAVPSSALSQATRDDQLIIPGQRIGVLSLGMTVTDARRSMFRVYPNLTPQHTAVPGVENLCWFSMKLCAVFVNDSAEKITTTTATYRTRQGVRVGMAYTEARKRLGKPIDYVRTPYGDTAGWSGMEAGLKNGIITDISVVSR